LGVVALALLLAGFFYVWVVFPLWGMPFNTQRHGNPPLVPAWALECWLWDGDKLNEDSALELLNGYRDNDLPVRTYLIDFPWATRLNDFNIDEKRYPNPKQFLADLKKRDLRTVLWMTTMVNSENHDRGLLDSADWFKEAASKGYLCGSDYQWKWWLGKGGFIDYTNPEAVKWWHGMQDQVLDLGVDGWKLDDTASFFTSRPLGVPAFYQKTHAGWMTTRAYMDHFYRDELKYGQSKNPDFITLSRPIDSVIPWGHPEGFTPLDASMVNWVGDNTHTWEDKTRGLERAIRCILGSAHLGYNIIGSDVGGYHGGTPIPPDLYVRWTQFSTFCGLFLNGGHEERRLWMRTPQELELIRKYSWLHTELVPYMYCSVVDAHNGGRRLMRPMEEGKYQYEFGDWLLVAPMYTPSENREVELPAGLWRYWFDDRKVIEGPTRISRDYPIGEFPVYIREGAIIPMHISREYTGIGQRDWDAFLTLNIYPCQYASFEVPHTDKSGTLNVTVRSAKSTTITLEGAAKPHILRVYSETKPVFVGRDGVKLVEGTDWQYLAVWNRLIIKTETAVSGSYTIRY
jgi:alpha-glucosidase (family GH31 glycosyl hydrolase)